MKLGDGEAAGSRLLLVDDEPSIIDSGSLMLGAEGYAVESAGNSSDVMTLIDKGYVPDLIICDYRLPGANGIDLIIRLRSRLECELPALMMTGDTSQAEMELSDCEWLRKPFSTERLLERVAHLLQGKR